jgi:two-component sensor histidine kinase
MSVVELFPDFPDLYITHELAKRASAPADSHIEMIAVQELAVLMASDPDKLMPSFVDAAMALVGGVSAGVSVFEPDPAPGQFRWQWVRGAFARFDGSPTPRNFSPCGVTLDRGEVTLTRYPERAYSWIRDAGVVCPEVLLAPLHVRGSPDLGTMWIVAPNGGHFTAEHARAISDLAIFVAAALRMVVAERKLKAALSEQAMLAHEMAHRTKNLFAVAEGMIRVTARATQTVPEFAKTLTGRLHALADANALVSRDTGARLRAQRGGLLSDLLETVLRPHDATGHAITLDGPPVALGDSAINGLALIFYELATNAAKYGSLSLASGSLTVRWVEDGDTLALDWIERGGPPVADKVQTPGFGSGLLEATAERQFGGELECLWDRQGLVARLRLNRGRMAG